MFALPSQLLEYIVHPTDRFHCVVGLDPIGTFTGVENISYEWAQFQYNELGRNYAPVTLPFEGPGKPGEITLKWGLIIRNMFYDWTESVNTRGKYTRMVHIIHLSRKGLPLRVFQLEEAWPTQWRYANLGGESSEMTVEEVTIAYERLTMVNLSAMALAGEALGGSFNEDDSYTANVGTWPDREPLPEDYVAEPGSHHQRSRKRRRNVMHARWPEQGLPDKFIWPFRGNIEEYDKLEWPPEVAKMRKYEASPGKWQTEALDEDYVAKPAAWFQAAEEEDYEAKVGEWYTEALEETYEAKPGDWYTEALPETYEAAGADAAKKADS